MEKKGIKELKEFVVFIASLANASDKATQSGGLGADDIVTFMPVLIKAPEALAGLTEAKLEYNDLDAAEKTELNVAFSAEFDLVDDKLEALVENAMLVGLELFKIINAVKALKSA